MVVEIIIKIIKKKDSKKKKDNRNSSKIAYKSRKINKRVNNSKIKN